MEKNSCLVYDTSEKPRMKLASIPKRVVALVVDGALVQLFGIPCVLVASALFFTITSSFLSGASNAFAGIAMNITEILSLLFIITIAPALYFGYCESSKWQATPGKRLMKLKIVDNKGDRLSFWMATWRVLFAEFFIVLFFGIPFLAGLAIYGYLKLSMPEWIWFEASMIHTLIVSISLATVFFTKNKQTLLDMATNRVVVDATEVIESEKAIESKTQDSLSKELSGIKQKKSWFTPGRATLAFCTLPLITLACVEGYSTWVRPMIEPGYAEKQARLKAIYDEKMNQTGTVVYCIKDIPKGATIYSEYLEEKEIEVAKIPQNSIESADYADGQKAKYRIDMGQILSTHDITGGDKLFSIDVQLDKDSFHKYKELSLGSDEDLAAKWIKERLNKKKVASN